ncbi:hypothetical protein PybrP1_007477 [[Pythium] brassicae (nom. inval.)]|nr:hypothetical protein PybrP1_007477 [[Pythium] brassicae (nom. inval.)]
MDVAPKSPAPTLTLTSVLATLRASDGDETAASARALVGALPHVVDAISSFLQPPWIWSLTRACERNLRTLVPRLTLHLPRPDADPLVWACECSRALIAAARHRDTAMVEWLHDHCARLMPLHALVEAARIGDLATLQWLADRHPRAPWLPGMMDAAAATGQLDTLCWLHTHPKSAGFSPNALSGAIRGGHTTTVKWLLANGADCSGSVWEAVHAALRNGHNETATCIMTRIDPYLSEYYAVLLACAIPAKRGDLAMIRWMQAYTSERRVPFYAMDAASDGGHLHVVQWLYDHRPEGCSSHAMVGTAHNGHMDVVQWLYKHKKDDVGVFAIDAAAEHGHLEISSSGCSQTGARAATAAAMNGAAARGHLRVAQWLHTHRSEGCSRHALRSAVLKRHYDVAFFLVLHPWRGVPFHLFSAKFELWELLDIARMLQRKLSGVLNIRMLRGRDNVATEVLN